VLNLFFLYLVIKSKSIHTRLNPILLCLLLKQFNIVPCFDIGKYQTNTKAEFYNSLGD